MCVCVLVYVDLEMSGCAKFDNGFMPVDLFWSAPWFLCPWSAFFFIVPYVSPFIPFYFGMFSTIQAALVFLLWCSNLICKVFDWLIFIV